MNRFDRSSSIARLSEQPFDVLIIGGGIVGAGVARDAALRGLRTALIEQHDFAYGTSSRSSRLLHGGLRYLAQGRVGLVREASIEKTILHRIAPHLAEPLPFLFPTYRDRKDWVLWQLKIGVKVYDLLCGGRNLGKSTWLSAPQVSEKVPGLQQVNLAGAVRYYDGFTNDARLTIDTLRSAEKAGGLVLNYCRYLDGVSKHGEWSCNVTDIPSGRSFIIKTRAVVNATGPWADGLPHSRVKLRLTKGVHLVVGRERIRVPETVVMTEGKRILFAIPWGERTILGTTDTDYCGRPESVAVDCEDINYVLRITNDFFPEARLSHGDVIRHWAGLRPLIADTGGGPSDISRSHEISRPEPGWWDVAGGKLTTYRLMGEQVVDKIVAEKRFDARICVTAGEALLPAGETRFSSILPPEVTREAVEHFVRREWVLSLGDLMLRRSGWHYYLKDAPDQAEMVAAWMADLLGWTGREMETELRAYRACAELGTAAAGSAKMPL